MFCLKELQLPGGCVQEYGSGIRYTLLLNCLYRNGYPLYKLVATLRCSGSPFSNAIAADFRCAMLGMLA